MKMTNEQSIFEALKSHDSSEHTKGETLPDSMRIILYCVRVVTFLLKSGISLNKAISLHEMLEENGYSLSSTTHLCQLVPLVLHEDIKTIQQERSGRPFLTHCACS